MKFRIPFPGCITAVPFTLWVTASFINYFHFPLWTTPIFGFFYYILISIFFSLLITRIFYWDD